MNLRITLRITLVPLLVLLWVTQAGAEGNDMYVELQAGPTFPEDSDLSQGGQSGELTYDTGFNVGGAAGIRFLDVGRAEVALSYRQADTDRLKQFGSTPVSGDVGLFTSMANGYIDIPINLPVTPYVGGGIGVGVVMADFRANGNKVDDDDTQFAYNLMGGLIYQLQEDVAVRVGYRYLATTDAEIQGVDTEVHLHEMVFGVRYEF
jgi:opacity protein-like surface antigen